MSEVRADTITASDGTGPVTLTKQSAAKAFVLFDQTVPEIDNSFNTSSLTDTSTGNGDVNWTNAMSDAIYITVTGIGYVSISSAYNSSLSDDSDSGNPRTASRFYFVATYGNSSSTVFGDNNNNQLAVFGDLA
jgi:hypothetical protein